MPTGTGQKLLKTGVFCGRGWQVSAEGVLWSAHLVRLR
jgi:hypothetical protein